MLSISILRQGTSGLPKANRERPFPSIEQVRYVLGLMPGGSDTERRNRAVAGQEGDGGISLWKRRHLKAWRVQWFGTLNIAPGLSCVPKRSTKVAVASFMPVTLTAIL